MVSGAAGSADLSGSRAALVLGASEAEEGAGAGDGAGGGGGGAEAADERLAPVLDALPPSAPEEEAVEVLGGGGGGGTARLAEDRPAEPSESPDAAPDVVEGVEAGELTAPEGRPVVVVVPVVAPVVAAVPDAVSPDAVLGDARLLLEAVPAEEVADEDEPVPRLLDGLGAAVLGVTLEVPVLEVPVLEAPVLPLVGVRSAGGGGGGGATRAAVEGALPLRPVEVLVEVLGVALGTGLGVLGRNATGGLGGASLPRAVWVVWTLSAGGCGVAWAGRRAVKTGGGICGVGRTAW